MSVQTQLSRITVPQIRAHKGGQPIVCLTCYHAHTARLLDQHVDLMLVGDSLGMVMHGLETTVGVTLDMMITHAKAVMRGSRRALVTGHAVRQLRGKPGGGVPQRRPRHAGNRRHRGEAGRRLPHG